MVYLSRSYKDVVHPICDRITGPVLGDKLELHGRETNLHRFVRLYVYSLAPTAYLPA
jgi:hypothetical protein